MRWIWLKSCFNSRLREEATAANIALEEPSKVSTHASVRRRQDLDYIDVDEEKFQLTPP